EFRQRHRPQQRDSNLSPSSSPHDSVGPGHWCDRLSADCFNVGGANGSSGLEITANQGGPPVYGGQDTRTTGGRQG
ncbi:unnamed protein product, partial [Ectocarpus sp. 12 AP-2014]